LGKDVSHDERPRIESGHDSSFDRGEYDFERLEAAVDFLLEEHQRLTSEKRELLDELVERERRLTALESRLAGEERKRLSALAGVDKALERLGRLRSSTFGAEPA
jgi:chromosome segregation ATPase